MAPLQKRALYSLVIGIVMAIAERHYIKIRWGGRFKSLKDWWHYEKKEDLSDDHRTFAKAAGDVFFEQFQAENVQFVFSHDSFIVRQVQTLLY